MSRTPEQTRAATLASIRRNGAQLQLKRTLREYRTASGKVEEGETQTWNGYAADWAYHTKDIDGTLIMRGDIRLLVSALDADGAEFPAPVSGDTATYAAECLNVIGAKLFRKAGVVVAYDVQLRRP